jgi:hypothetical protein
MQSPDRRLARRAATSLEVLIALEGCVEADRGRLRSLSASGAFVEMGLPPDQGRAVKLLLERQISPGRVAIAGRVVRVTADGAGIAFSPLEPEAQGIVLRLVDAAPELRGEAEPGRADTPRFVPVVKPSPPAGSDAISVAFTPPGGSPRAGAAAAGRSPAARTPGSPAPARPAPPGASPRPEPPPGRPGLAGRLRRWFGG